MRMCSTVKPFIVTGLTKKLITLKMSDDKNEISEVSLETPSQNIPLDDTEKLTPLNEFRNWIKRHPEYPQKISKTLCYW